MSAVSIVGLDLAGVETRPTGCCVLVGMEAETSLMYTDKEILTKIQKPFPEL